MSEALIPRLLTVDMILKHYIPVVRSTLFEMISKGTFPAATKQFGRKQRYWFKEDIEAWISSPQRAAAKGAADVA
ncbi:MAG TPA: AlpA family phage regulatory protein [Tepidisphaeraceae bacterium]|jgi:predicted DNA-binding transcriptional regulator AlpA